MENFTCEAQLKKNFHLPHTAMLRIKWAIAGIFFWKICVSFVKQKKKLKKKLKKIFA